MDSDDKVPFAKSQVEENAARIVAEIGRIEQDYRLAEGPLSDWFLSDLAVTLKGLVPETWEVMRTDWNIVIISRGWTSTRRIGRGDACLEIVEIGNEDDDHTWIAAAVGAAGSKLGLELKFRPGLMMIGDGLTKDKAHAAALQKIGFIRDDTGTRLYIPLAINQVELAKGFAENDLDAAFEPVRNAISAVVGSKAALDTLVQEAIEKGKGS